MWLEAPMSSRSICRPMRVVPLFFRQIAASGPRMSTLGRHTLRFHPRSAKAGEVSAFRNQCQECVNWLNIGTQPKSRRNPWRINRHETVRQLSLSIFYCSSHERTSFFSHSSALFYSSQILILPIFKSLRTLCQKHPGWGVPIRPLRGCLA